ncbi:oxidoreductase [Youhaiella tibetensis]|nr:alpha/beta hydrolase [Youhaiella tibetensis]GGF13752.1 oxidoreductase [Youhaiella tibetensis]
MQISALAAVAVAAMFATPAFAEDRTGTLPVNGLEMYYEIHGEGEPLVLIHGAWMNIDTNWAALMPTLAMDHKVIALEMQGHGRTTDRDTPITYEGMADDVAAALDALQVEKADIFGYSMGAGIALQLVIRHPEKVERLIAASGGYSTDGLAEGYDAMVATMTPEMFVGTPLESEYKRLSPTPDHFRDFAVKMIAFEAPFSWPESDIKAIKAPTLLIGGDADIVTLEHQASLYRLLGGTENGDINGLSTAQLLILPGTSHIGVFFNPLNVEIMKLAVPAFLSAELPPKPPQF